MSIYKNSDGVYLKELDQSEEGGFIVRIIRENENLFLVDFEAIELKNVWVKKGELGINTRNYDGQQIPLFESYSTSSNIISILFEEQTVKVLDVCKDWAYIEGIGKSGEKVRGWLQPDMQCWDPYTTCP